MTDGKAGDVFRLPGFAAFWWAETISGLGSYITVLALQVLVIVTLNGSSTDVGLLNAARWAPYVVLGLIAGALVDRRPRKPILIATDLGRAALLGAIPALAWIGGLSFPLLLAVVALLGVLTLLHDAASQSFVPRLAPREALLAANARLDQGAAVSQTAGPIVGGALVSALSAPIAVLVDAVTYVVSAVAMMRVRVSELATTPATQRTRLWGDIGEGLAWVYRHRTLAPMALSTHAWFVFNAMTGAIFAPFVLLELGLSAFELGVTLACAGAAALVGSFAAAPLGRRFQAGRVVIACRALSPIAWGAIALAPGADAGLFATLGMLALGQALFGLSLGAENSNEMAYRQSVTPDALQGRMNTTMRSINRAMVVFAAPLGGVLADALGYRTALWIAVAGFVLVPIFLMATPFRDARHAD